MHILIICEKNSAAIRIANILSKNKMKKGFSNRVPTFTFQGNNTKYTVMGLRGHILTLDYQKQYNIWNKIPPVDLIDKEPYKRPEAQNIISTLHQLSKDIDEVIIATDYDREGELIGTEALDVIKQKRDDVTIRRAKFSALTKTEIDDAFENLTDVDYNLSKSAETRQLIDLVWGATLTRFISLSSGQTGRDFLSVGRVQSPTLALIVGRELKILAFKPEPYWKLEATVGTKPTFVATHEKARFQKEDEKELEAIMEKLKDQKKGTIETLEVNENNDYPPSPFNTTTFLAACSAQGLGTARAMSIAEDLYIRGYIRYPRTDNTVYPRSLDLYGVVRVLKETEFKPLAEEILSQDRIRTSRGKFETTDHPPIYPTDAAPKKKLRMDEWQIYELIVRRFLATVAPIAIYKESKVTVNIKDELFKVTGKKYVELGWRKYYTYLKLNEKSLPELKQGQEVKIDKIEKKEKATQPPKRCTQGSLIQEMDKLGLGTKSTRHDIIQKLYSRGYLEGKYPIPTDSGIAVTKALEHYAEPITKSDMTSTLEENMTNIAEGEKTREDVVDESKGMLKEIFKTLEPNKRKIGDEIRKALQSQNVITTCEVCEKEGREDGVLVIKRSKRGKRFVGCINYPRCMNSYPLPQKGKVIPVEGRCPTCSAPQVKIISHRRRPWLTCINMECPSKVKKGKKPGEEE